MPRPLIPPFCSAELRAQPQRLQPDLRDRLRPHEELQGLVGQARALRRVKGGRRQFWSDYPNV